jgi:hypothetical protein
VQQLDWIKACIDQCMMGFELCLQQKLELLAKVLDCGAAASFDDQLWWQGRRRRRRKSSCNL